MADKYAYEKKCFLENTANHVMEVTLDQGVYRHIRFKDPKSTAYWFDITTWEGFLCISGDMGCYVFSRLHDMFDFFRVKSNQPEINPYYWEEKIQCGTNNGKNITQEWSQEKFIKNVKEALNRSLHDLPLSEAKEVVASVYEEILSCNGEFECVGAIYNFDDTNDVFLNFWEYDCNEYTYHYLWCCFAIVYGIKQYSEYKENLINNGDTK